MTTVGTTAAADGAALARLVARRPEPDREGVAPDEAALRRILEVATTVPDHGGLRPWRFVVVTGTGQQRVADALEAGLRQTRGDDVPDAAVAKMRGKASAAPCQVAVIASPKGGTNVPVWEQEVSAACTGYAIVLAATGLGLGAVWKTAAVIDTPPVREAFGVAEGERLLGWINLGSAAPLGVRSAADRALDLTDVVTRLDG